MKDRMIGYDMISAVRSISPEASIKEALEYMKNFGIRHLPAIENGKLVGIVSERDLKAAINIPSGDSLLVEDVMSRDVFVTSATSLLSEVAGQMAREKFGSAVIINAKHQVTGIFTTIDALKILANLADDNSTLEYFFGEPDDYYESSLFASIGGSY